MSRHLVKLPGALLLISCRPGDRCGTCAQIPIDRLKFSDFLWDKFEGIGPIPELKPGTDHFKTYLEASNSQNQVPAMPPEYDGWKCCLLCPKRFYYRKRTELLRHLNLMHRGKELTDLSLTPFECQMPLPRQTDATGMPWGEEQLCPYRAATAAELTAHRVAQHPHPLPAAPPAQHAEHPTQHPLPPPPPPQPPPRVRGRAPPAQAPPPRGPAPSRQPDGNVCFLQVYYSYHLILW
jgi:hypothetical protein